jgi:hypothetical protein
MLQRQNPAVVSPSLSEISTTAKKFHSTNQPPKTQSRSVEVLGFRQCQRNALLGFVTVRIRPPCLVISDIAVQRCGRTGKRWLSLPERPLFDACGMPIRDHCGKIAYVAVLKFDPCSDKWFTSSTLIALDEFLALNNLTLPNPKDQ